MTTGSAVFTAAHSAAGYYYQARLALYEGLRFVYNDPGVEIAIERFDDVSFEQDGEPLALLQTKHHVNKLGDLTDSSSDLWKTLRVWSEHAQQNPAVIGRTRLALLTTGKAPNGSAASFLRPGDGRDTVKAKALLIAAAASSTNKALQSAFSAFQSLAPEMCTALVTAIEVLDNAPVLTELESLIEDSIKLIAPRGKAPIARQMLEGWWWPRICAALQEGAGSVSVLELEAKLDDIRDTMKRDALPLDMEHVDPPDTELAPLNDMAFVRQLRTAGVGNNRIEYAKRDYYRAFTQRSRWTRESLLFDGEVPRFEKTLIEEWQPQFSAMCDGLGDSVEDSTLRAAGQNLYHWVETEARFPFRTISARFLSVGSYHILANDLRVGWHRDYEALVARDEENRDG